MTGAVSRTATIVLPLLLVAGPLGAQDSLAASPGAPAPPDSVAKRASQIKPVSVLWRSLLVPGWGQAKLDRQLTAAVFITVEGISLGMMLKADHELHYLRGIGDPRGDSKKQEVQDWMVILVFNHLLSGLEAFAAAHLRGFPGDLHLRAAPQGGWQASLSLPAPVP